MFIRFTCSPTHPGVIDIHDHDSFPPRRLGHVEAFSLSTDDPDVSAQLIQAAMQKGGELMLTVTRTADRDAIAIGGMR